MLSGRSNGVRVDKTRNNYFIEFPFDSLILIQSQFNVFFYHTQILLYSGCNCTSMVLWRQGEVVEGGTQLRLAATAAVKGAISRLVYGAASYAIAFFGPSLVVHTWSWHQNLSVVVRRALTRVGICWRFEVQYRFTQAATVLRPSLAFLCSAKNTAKTSACYTNFRFYSCQ